MFFLAIGSLVFTFTMVVKTTGEHYMGEVVMHSYLDMLRFSVRFRLRFNVTFILYWFNKMCGTCSGAFWAIWTKDRKGCHQHLMMKLYTWMNLSIETE